MFCGLLFLSYSANMRLSRLYIWLLVPILLLSNIVLCFSEDILVSPFFRLFFWLYLAFFPPTLLSFHPRIPSNSYFQRFLFYLHIRRLQTLGLNRIKLAKHHNTKMAVLQPYKGTYYLWAYLPSTAASITFLLLFLIATVLNFWNIFKRRSWFCLPFAIGCLCKFHSPFNLKSRTLILPRRSFRLRSSSCSIQQNR